MNTRCFLLLIALLPLPATAEEAVPAARSPGDMSADERTQMMHAANDYNTCVYTEAINNIDADPDIRRIADAAMGSCQPGLDDLGARITGWGYPEYFAGRFTRNVRDRAARKLLAELAIRKSR